MAFVQFWIFEILEAFKVGGRRFERGINVAFGVAAWELFPFSIRILELMRYVEVGESDCCSHLACWFVYLRTDEFQLRHWTPFKRSHFRLSGIKVLTRRS